MRQGYAAVAGIVALAALAASGCGTRPTVGDGVLGLDWAEMPEPVVATPASDVCTAGSATAVGWDMAVFGSEPVACTQEHLSETYYVGSLAADASAAQPEVGDDLFREAYGSCATRASEFLGGDFHTARVAIIPVQPTQRQWRGDARWYRCEMLEISTASGAVARRATSLRGGLRRARPLSITCAKETLSDDKRWVEEVAFVACGASHDVELTGIHTSSDGPYPGDEAAHDKALDACFGIGARYLGMTRTALHQVGGIAWTAWGGGEERWSAGDRSNWCFMGEYPRRALKGSIKGRQPGSFRH